MTPDDLTPPERELIQMLWLKRWLRKKVAGTIQLDRRKPPRKWTAIPIESEAA